MSTGRAFVGPSPVLHFWEQQSYDGRSTVGVVGFGCCSAIRIPTWLWIDLTRWNGGGKALSIIASILER